MHKVDKLSLTIFIGKKFWY